MYNVPVLYTVHVDVHVYIMYMHIIGCRHEWGAVPGLYYWGTVSRHLEGTGRRSGTGQNALSELIGSFMQVC